MSLWHRFSQSVTNSWYSTSWGWTRLLRPLSGLFALVARRRRQRYLSRSRWSPPVPVVVVGNITVGGTGKTPVVAALVKALEANGFRPGIVSRGFGVSAAASPLWVTPESDPAIVGDEPVMLARQLNVPLVVAADRVKAAQRLSDDSRCDVIIADDGLQHYNLQRHIEMLVLDGERMLGNGLCLPAGPLREPVERMNSVDMILVNSATDARAVGDGQYAFCLEPAALVSVGGFRHSLAVKGKVHAVAGIGNPQRFFNTLRRLGFEVIEHAFADHHPFTPKDICFDDPLPVIMTAKDAVKCVKFVDQRHWFLPVTTRLPTALIEQLVAMLDALVSHRKHDG